MLRSANLRRLSCVGILAVALGSCGTNAPLPAYVASDKARNHNSAIDLKGVELGLFASDVAVDPTCRGGWAEITPGGERDFGSYVQHAVAGELRLATHNSGNAPRVVLTGHLERLEFSSTVDWLSSGYWDIRLRVDSSNGRALTVESRQSFKTGYHDVPACEKVAAQFPHAVRALVETLVERPEFPFLLR